MGSLKEHPRYNVVSLRISDEEREALNEFVRKSSRSVSQLMREAMEQLLLKMEGYERG
jgi:predicted DNA-binding protein